MDLKWLEIFPVSVLCVTYVKIKLLYDIIILEEHD